MALRSVSTVSDFVLLIDVCPMNAIPDPVERPYDPRPYDSRYRSYDDLPPPRARRGGYDDYRGRDYDRGYREYDRGGYERGYDRGYDRRYDDRRY